MQSHVSAGSTVKDIPVHLNKEGGHEPFAVLAFGHVEVFAESLADCDEGIRAFTEARDLLSPIWAVMDDVEGEVAGPMTRAAAEKYITDNGSYHVASLTIERAVPEEDAKLSPPATPARDTEGTPPGHQLPAGDVAGWDEPLPPYHATNGNQCAVRVEVEDGEYFCTAQEGHAGPLHIAYGTGGKICHSWPAADVHPPFFAGTETDAGTETS